MWTAPQASAATGPVYDYIVQASTDYTGDANAATWFTVHDNVSSLTRSTVQLTNGVGYVFRVAAVTKNGTSAFSAPSPQFMPFDPTVVPDAPTVTVANSPQAGRAKLVWTPPATNAGSLITGYVVRYRLAGTTTWRAVRQTNPLIVFQGLQSGQDYEFQVRAENNAGVGSLTDIVTIRIL